MSDTVTEKASEAKEEVTQNGNGNLKKLLIPAAAGVGTLAATYAATKAPSLFRERVMPKLEEESGEEVAKVGKEAASKLSDQGGVLGALAGKATGKSGGGGREKTRRLPIQRWTDVAVPVATAYEKWTEFEEFPKFMHRVLNVEEKEDNLIAWDEKIWFSTRHWEAEILENRKNDRIVWETTQGTSHKGMISFHQLDDQLTRIMVTIDFHPTGMIEKMASGLRFAKRAVQADLARFKAYVEMAEAEGVEYTQASTTESDSQKDEDADESDRGQSDGQSANGRSRDELDQSRQERAERREQRRS